MQDILDPTLNELYHHGILGQKWGVRRYQNYDGSLTNSGKSRYSLNNANNFINNFKSKSFNDIKIDVLDYANRKGVLDFLDSKADAPFKAIREVNLGYTPKSARNPLDFLKKTNDIDSMIPHVSKPGELDTYVPMLEKEKSNDRFAKAVDYASTKFNPYEWGKASVDLLGQSVEDKKLGILSKDVRDIERAAAGKEFIEKLKSESSLATKLSSEFYKTDFRGYTPAFKGTPYETTTSKQVVDFMWEPVYSSDGRKVGENRVATKYKDVEIADVSKPTREFLSYQESMKFPSDYKHVAEEYSDVQKSNAYSILKNNTFKHSDVYDFLEHHGIKGQKWGNRRYQNGDGSLTALGRVHYGVGAARESVGKVARAASGALKSGASKTGEAIRKAVKPTDQELLEKYDKAQAKQARKDLKQEIREMNGYKKRIKDMTDQEVINQINRYKNEATLKALKKDAHKTPLQKSLEQATRDAISKAAGATLQAALGNVGQSIANAFDTKENKVRREAQMVEDQAKIDKAKGGKSAADILKEYSENAKNSKNAYQAELEEAALRGNEDAKRKLSDFKNASKGSYKDPTDSPDYVETEEGKGTYEPPASRSSNRQNENNVSDVMREAGSNVYSTVEDVPTGRADDYISRLSRRELPAPR